MLNKKVSLSNSAAKITSVKLESNNLVTYYTEDAHGLFVGAIASVSGVSGGPTGATSPNPIVSNVYRVDNPTSFTVYVSTAYTATSFPATFTSTGTVQAAQGSLSAINLSYAQPVKAVRPTYFNYISPTVTAIASGNRVLVSWDASGVAYPTPTVTVGRYDSTGTTLLGSVSTAAAGSSVIDPASSDLTNGTQYVYKVTAANTASTVNASTAVTALYVNTPATVNAVATPSTANSITVSWSAADTNAALTSYTVQRKVNGGGYNTTYASVSGSVTSYVDSGLTQTSTYTYKIVAIADYTAAGTGIITSATSTATATVTPYYVSAVTPVAATTPAVANSITVTWSAPTTSTPALTGYSLQRSSDGGSSWSSNLTLSTPTATSYVDSNASSGLTYTYRLAAINSQVTSAYTSSGTATAYYLADPLVAPTASNTSTSTTSVTITGSYIANPAILSYSLQRSSNGGSSYSSVETGLSLPYTDTTVAANTSYLYQIKAVSNQLTTANWSAASNSILSYSVPFNPTSVTAASVSNTSTSVIVSWSGASVNSAGPPITSYTIGYKLTSTTVYTTQSGISPASSSFTVTGLTTDSAYNFRVLAVNSIGTATTTGAIVATATPVHITGGNTLLLGSDPVYFNETENLYAYTPTGRSVLFEISTNGTVWTPVTGATSTSTVISSADQAMLAWTVDTTSLRYFRATAAQDSLYTTTVSNITSITPLANTLSTSLYSATYANGADITGTATNAVTIVATDRLGSPVAGASITWYKSQYSDTARTSFATSTTDVNGRATYTVAASSTTPINAASSYEIRAEATKTNYNSATISSGRANSYSAYVVETESSLVTIARSYAGSNAVRGSNTAEDLYYGYFDTSWDMQKSAMGFSGITWTKVDAAAAVTAGSIRLSKGNAAGTNPGTVYLGTHKNGSAVSGDWTTYGSTAFGTITPQLQSISQSESTIVTTALNSAMLTNIQSGGVRGITLGPPTLTTLLYYGKYDGILTATTSRPLLSLTYKTNPIKSLV